MLITIQSKMPCIIGLNPTDRITSVDSDAPMKNIVIVRHLRAIPETAWPSAGTQSRMNVFKRIATMK